MKKSDYYRALIAGLGILMVSESAKALIPTVDANAIAEGIKTNIELVKQSKVVVEATKLTGEIKSITGEAKAALSDLENSEIAEELRKAQKEAENLQEAAATYQEYKEKIEQEKEKLEENKEKLNNLKDKATQTYTAAKEKYEEAKEVYNEAKSLYDEAKTAADTYIPVVENVVNTKSTQPQTQETTTTQTAPAPQTTTYNNTRSTQNTQQTASEDDELKDAQAEIEQLRAALAELMSQTKDDTAIQENSATITDLEEAQAEIERLKAELAKYQEAAKRIQEAIEENEKELKLSDNGNNVDIDAVRKILDEFELPPYEGKADKAKNGDVIVSSPQPVTEEAPKVKIRNVNGTEISSPVKRKRTESAKTLSKPRKTKYHDIDITHKYTGTAEQINKYLGGVLKGKGAKFIELQEKYGINAAFLAAIAINESSNGTSYGARKRNNVGGVREYGSYKFKVYERVEDCLEDMADFLSDNYVGEGRTTIGAVGAKYCPVDDKSDKENINQFWPRNVGFHMSRIDPSVRYQV